MGFRFLDQTVPHCQALAIIMSNSRDSHFQAHNQYKGYELVVHSHFDKLPGLKKAILEGQEMAIDANALDHPKELVAQLYVPVSSKRAFVQAAFSIYQHTVTIESLEDCLPMCLIIKSGSIKGGLFFVHHEKAWQWSGYSKDLSQIEAYYQPLWDQYELPAETYATVTEALQYRS
jgi:hypothetical protein